MDDAVEDAVEPAVDVADRGVGEAAAALQVHAIDEFGVDPPGIDDGSGGAEVVEGVPGARDDAGRRVADIAAGTQQDGGVTNAVTGRHDHALVEDGAGAAGDLDAAHVTGNNGAGAGIRNAAAGLQIDAVTTDDWVDGPEIDDGAGTAADQDAVGTTGNKPGRGVGHHAAGLEPGAIVAGGDRAAVGEGAAPRPGIAEDNAVAIARGGGDAPGIDHRAAAGEKHAVVYAADRPGVDRCPDGSADERAVGTARDHSGARIGDVAAGLHAQGGAAGAGRLDGAAVPDRAGADADVNRAADGAGDRAVIDHRGNRVADDDALGAADDRAVIDHRAAAE